MGNDEVGGFILFVVLSIVMWFFIVGIVHTIEDPYNQGAVDVTTGRIVCHQWEVTDEWHCGPAEVVQ